MPFLAGPPEPLGVNTGICSSCTENGRIWRYCERVVDLTLGYSGVLSYAICRACLETAVDLAGEDNDDGGLRAADPPG
jgi:hypothetical protein